MGEYDKGIDYATRANSVVLLDNVGSKIMKNIQKFGLKQAETFIIDAAASKAFYAAGCISLCKFCCQKTLAQHMHNEKNYFSMQRT